MRAAVKQVIKSQTAHTLNLKVSGKEKEQLSCFAGTGITLSMSLPCH